MSAQGSVTNWIQEPKAGNHERRETLSELLAAYPEAKAALSQQRDLGRGRAWLRYRPLGQLPSTCSKDMNDRHRLTANRGPERLGHEDTPRGIVRRQADSVVAADRHDVR